MKNRDQIMLKGMMFYGYHGVNPEERLVGQKFVVDVTVECSLLKPSLSDMVYGTVSYSDLFKTVKSIVEGPPRNLLESVAKNISEAILLNYDIESKSVTIKKPDVPINGAKLDYAGVTLTRNKGK